MESILDLLDETNINNNTGEITQLVISFLINLVVTGIIIRFFYLPKSTKQNYGFTFTLMAVSVFFIIFLLGSVKMKIGFALGIFAIFGILRYRTEPVPVREMTYLFTITAISVVNGLTTQAGYTEVAIVNAIFLATVAVLEYAKWPGNTNCKLVLYDNINLITPTNHQQLIDDLTQRTGLDIVKVEIGYIDFLKDAAMIKVFYHSNESEQPNEADYITKLPNNTENI